MSQNFLKAALQNADMLGGAEDRLKLWHAKFEKHAPGKAVTTFKTVRSFCKSNYVPLSCKIPQYIVQREEEYTDVSKQELREMLALCDLETKTFSMLCAQSGHRDGEIADLRLKHIKEGLDGDVSKLS